MLNSTKHCQFAALALLTFFNGCFVSSFGPLIPHYSSATGLDETDFSYLFMVRSIANILGGFLVKILLKKAQLQSMLLAYISIIIVSLFCATISLQNYNLTAALLLASTALVGTAVITFGVTIKLFLEDRPDYWIQLIGFVFGIGAMCGPFFVFIFEIQAFKALSLAHVIILILLWLYPLPNLDQQGQQSLSKGIKLSSRSVLFICLIFFFYATVELGMGSWISTYAIKAGVTDIQGSAIYSMLFWFPNCLGRLGWMYVPGKIEQKLGISLKAVLLATFFTLLFQLFQWYNLVCIFAPITSGILIAGVFGFGIALPVDNGFVPDPQYNASFVLANAFGEGLLIMPLGYSIKFLGFKALMIEIFVFAGLSYYSFLRAVQSMKDDKKTAENQLLREML